MKFILVVDESYFKLKSDEKSGNDRYLIKDNTIVNSDVQNRGIKHCVSAHKSKDFFER